MNIEEAEMASNQIPPSASSGRVPTLIPVLLVLFWLRFWLRFGHGLGDDRGDVTVADGHSGRKEMLYDFNGFVSISLTRSSSVVIA